MLIQGTNIPIKLVFSMSLEEHMQSLLATLWTKDGERLLKSWEMEDMNIDDNIAYLPLLEEETRNFPEGKLKLEIKGLNNSDQTVFWEEAELWAKKRKDKTIELIE